MPDYTRLSRVLHRVVLGSPLIAEPLWSIERRLFSGSPDRHNAVYITGLARAGSTALLQALHDSGAFAALTYRDMPFVLAPNLWSRLTGLHPATLPRRERPHKDGLVEDANSPEGLEEVFWRETLGATYIHDRDLSVHRVSAATVCQLRDYQSLVCRRYGKDRYLAKNNNMILRLASLAPQTPDTRFLVLFRHPVAQALSLLDQHQRFSVSDFFVRDYMTWLVHHEFGATHRPFRFSDVDPSNRSRDTFEYWLERWIDAYGYLLHVLRSSPANVTAIQYERLCDDAAYRTRLFGSLGVSMTEWAFKNKNRYTDKGDEALLAQSMRIYDQLCTLTSAA